MKPLRYAEKGKAINDRETTRRNKKTSRISVKFLKEFVTTGIGDRELQQMDHLKSQEYQKKTFVGIQRKE